MYSFMISNMPLNNILAVACLMSFVVTFILLKIPFGFLPKDQGRAYAVNGELSKGKVRGVGLLLVVAFIVVSLLTAPLNLENIFYYVLIDLMMLSGFLDDASKNPWSDYKKGLIDLILSVATAAVYVYYNGTEFSVFGYAFSIPAWAYVILGTILIWMSINVTNCTDGVDGLCGNISIITLMSFVVICSEKMGEHSISVCAMTGAIIAYLFFNTKPSVVLMGDAGSRAIGFLIAITAMHSGRPFLWLIVASVMIFDGGMGLVKVFLLRFFKIHIFKNVRFPFHDHLRKNINWPDTYVVYRLTLIQVILCIAAYLLPA